MSEFPNGQDMTVDFNSSESEENLTQAQAKRNLWRAGPAVASAVVLEKIQELFQICDSEDKGYITCTDMKKLDEELPLTAEELENVFISLDSDKNGCLTLEEFSSGFSDFLYGCKVSQVQDQTGDLSQTVPEVLYQDESQERDEDDRQFSLLMERLGASNIFKDHSEVRSLWAQLQKDEPRMLSNFEEFLARVTSQIRQERKEMENALRMKAATHDGEIQQLYEEMEQQMNTKKHRQLLKDSERLQLRGQDLELQLSYREQELEQLSRQQRRLELQCQELHSENQESRVENIKLKTTNEELSRDLEITSNELSLAQEQLVILEEQAMRLQQEKEMEIYRISERLQREKQSLIKQLDLLREMNKHLRDEQDITSMKQNSSLKKFTHKERSAILTSITDSEKIHATRETITEEVAQPYSRKLPKVNGRMIHSSALADGKTRTAECIPNTNWASAAMRPGPNVTDSHPEAWSLHRIISIEEDHLPNLLQEDPHSLLHQLTEEEDRGEQQEAETDLEMCSPNMPMASADSAPLAQGKMHFSIQKARECSVPSLVRGQPVGKETLQKGPVEGTVSPVEGTVSPVEGTLGLPECIFKVIFIGNSSVGKTAFLRYFCDGQFHPTTATVGLDCFVQTLNLGDSHVTLQLWDTAGQERYRCITQQFFRKADGVVVIYDVTTHDSFTSVHSWLASIQESMGEPVPIMLLGNKSDKDSMREVPTTAGERLAQDMCLIFYECSAYTGHNVLEAMLHLSRVMREQENRVLESTVLLVDKPVKKKACCN